MNPSTQESTPSMCPEADLPLLYFYLSKGTVMLQVLRNAYEEDPDVGSADAREPHVL